MVNILSNGVDFLSIARSSYANNGIGLSASSRALTNEFLSNSSVLFNSLYTESENAELNLATQIKALRSRLGISAEEVVFKSDTLGNSVDTEV